MYCSRSSDLLTHENFSLTDASALFNALSDKDGSLSFEGFISALQEISNKLYGNLSSKNKLKRIFKLL